MFIQNLLNEASIGEEELRRIRRWLPVSVVIAVGLTLSVVGFHLTGKIEQQNRDIRFQHLAENQVSAVRNKLASTIEILSSLRGLFTVSDNVDRRQFRTFLETQGIGTAVQALEWIPRISQADRKNFEVSARRDGLPEFRFSERDSDRQAVSAADREVYFPVYYLYPHLGNEAAFGFDLGSSEERLSALNRARDTGEMVASARITLVQETGDQYGVLVFAPVYKHGLPKSTVAERRENLIGFGLGVFRVSDLIDTATGADLRSKFPVSVRVLDKSAAEDSQLLYPKTSNLGDGAFVRSALIHSQTLNVAGRSWLVEAVPAPGSEFGKATLLSWATLLVGLLFTTLLALYLILTGNRMAEVNALVRARTAQLQMTEEELAYSKRELEQFAYIASHDLRSPLRGIDNLVSWIEEDLAEFLSGDNRKHMDLLRSRVKRLEQLLEDLLQYSRAGRSEAKTSIVDTKSIIDEIIEMSPPPEGMSVSMQNELPVFKTQKDPLTQVLGNLIGNAIKHHDQTEGRVEISTKDLGDRYEFTVSDDGPGIDEEFGEKIFLMFQTLRPRDEVEGSGMGLAIVRKLVEKQGGSVRLGSPLNAKGAAFQFDWKKATQR